MSLPEIRQYAIEGDKFRSRQHVLNHLDMIVGTSAADADLLKRAIFVSEGGRSGIVHMGTFSPERSRKCRAWVLREAQYASEWQQLFPIDADGEYFSPNKLVDSDDVTGLLRECVDIWIYDELGGDSASFEATTAAVVLLGDWEVVRADRILVRRRLLDDEEILPSSINTFATMGAKYHRSKEWLLFSRRICASEYVKGALIDRQQGVCAICGNPLGGHAVVHHVDYDHTCSNSGAEGTVPNCEQCCKTHPHRFEDCVSRLRAVHPSCNYLIEGTL
ncbi:MAG: hypothetical protein IKG21_01535 [Atopobiaceae bacterium]|nr:hypothetical protein [Atopobiaceae bacterium]